MSGFVVCEAFDGQQPLELLGGFDPDAVLTDIMMPRVDGVELIRRIRATPAWASLTVVAMTAIAGGCERAMEAGADRIQPKPVDLETLVACLRCVAWPGRGGPRRALGRRPP